MRMSKRPSRSLSSLTLDEIKKALDLAKKDVKLDGNVVLLTEDRYDKALTFLREHFVPDEPMYKSLGIQWTEELADIRFRSAFQLNLSLILEDPESSEIIAIRSTKIAKRGSSLDLNKIDDVLLRELYRAENNADESSNFFEHYGTDEAIQLLGLGVHKKHRGKGLATKLLKFYITFLERLGISPLYVKVEGSSNYSKSLYQNLGFQTLYELKFGDYFVDGKQVFEDTGVHKSMKCYGYKVWEAASGLEEILYSNNIVLSTGDRNSRNAWTDTLAAATYKGVKGGSWGRHRSRSDCTERAV